MPDLLALARQEYPECEPTHLLEAALPVYFVQVQVEVLEPQALTPFESYFLHAVALGVNTRESIATLLGLEDRDVVTPGGSLLKREFITQGPVFANAGRPIILTEKGKEALKTQKVPPIPIRATAQMHFNTVTWTPIPVEETWRMERMDKEGLFILPAARTERPTLGDFTLKAVENALRSVPYFQKNRLLQLLHLQKVSPEYIAPVMVVVLCEPNSQQRHMAVFQQETLLKEESAALQRLFEMNHFVLPDDAVALVSPTIDIPSTLPPVVAQVARQMTRSKEQERILQEELAETQRRQNGTGDQKERVLQEVRIASLENDLSRRQEEIQSLSTQLQRQQGRFLRTEEHRAVLLQALKEAREEIIIISPWLNRRACDDALCELVAAAVKRSVRIRIGYGITERPNDPDIGRNRANAQRVIRAMRTEVEHLCTAEQAKLLEIERIGDTHEKILICDKQFGVLGSFNWLSYRGEVDDGYRNETSIVLRDQASISALTRIAVRALPQLGNT